MELDMEQSFHEAFLNKSELFGKARDAVWENSNFTFSEKMEIDDLIQKGIHLILLVSRNFVREWFLLKIQQLVNDYDDKWFETKASLI